MPGRSRKRVSVGAADRLAGAQPLEVEVLDDPGVGVGADVDDHLLALLEGVDVVEGEAGVASQLASALPVERSISVKRVPRSGFQR